MPTLAGRVTDIPSPGIIIGSVVTATAMIVMLFTPVLDCSATDWKRRLAIAPPGFLENA